MHPLVLVSNKDRNEEEQVKQAGRKEYFGKAPVAQQNGVKAIERPIERRKNTDLLHHLRHDKNRYPDASQCSQYDHRNGPKRCSLVVRGGNGANHYAIARSCQRHCESHKHKGGLVRTEF